MSSAQRRLVRANAVVAAGTGLSRITGLARWAALAIALGRLGGLPDAYNLANVTPNIVYELLLGGVLTASLVPLFVQSHDDGDDDATSAIVTVALVVTAVLTVAAVIAAPLIVEVYASGRDEAFRSVATDLARLCLPQIFFYGLTALLAALLNSRDRFAAPALAPVLNNVVVVAVLLALPHLVDGELDIAGARANPTIVRWLGIGTTAGIAAMALVLVVAVGRAGIHLRAHWRPRHPAVVRLVRLSGWTVGYVVANQVALVVVTRLALRTTGDLTAYQVAFVFFQLPHGLLAVSLMTTFAPGLARRAQRGDERGFARTAVIGLRATLLLVVPAAAGYAVLGRSVVAVTLQHGSFTEADAYATTRVLIAFALGLPGFSVYLFALRGFFARQDTRTPFIVNCVENALNIVFALALVGRYGAPGLAGAYSLAYLVAAVVAVAVLRRRVGWLDGAALARTAVSCVVAATAMALVVAVVVSPLPYPSGGGALARLLVGVPVGVVTYAAGIAVLRRAELGWLARRGAYLRP